MVVGSVETVMLSVAMDCVLVEGYITTDNITVSTEPTTIHTSPSPVVIKYVLETKTQ